MARFHLGQSCFGLQGHSCTIYDLWKLIFITPPPSQCFSNARATSSDSQVFKILGTLYFTNSSFVQHLFPCIFAVFSGLFYKMPPINSNSTFSIRRFIELHDVACKSWIQNTRQINFFINCFWNYSSSSINIFSATVYETLFQFRANFWERFYNLINKSALVLRAL